MTMMVRPVSELFVICACLIFLSACLAEERADHITKDYEISWKNKHRTRALYKHGTIVPGHIYAAAVTDKYIIVKRHPFAADNSFFSDSTCYYIVEITTNKKQDKPVYGPLGQTGYDSLAASLGLDGVSFDHEYPLGRHWKLR